MMKSKYEVVYYKRPYDEKCNVPILNASTRAEAAEEVRRMKRRQEVYGRTHIVLAKKGGETDE